MSFLPTYTANDPCAVRALAETMRAMPEEAKILGLIGVHATGLMHPRGVLRLGMWVVGLRGAAFKGRLLAEIYRRDPAGALLMWEQTCLHVTHGHDTEDADSAGGWSQREIDLFLKVMRRLPADPSATPGSA